jgi:hypothetical protein
LRNATVEFVRLSRGVRADNGTQRIFDFSRKLEVDAYQARDLRPVFRGRIVQDADARRHARRALFRRNRPLILTMAVIALILAVLTLPPVWTGFLVPGSTWYEFATGFVGRLGSAALFAAIAAAVAPYLERVDDGRDPVIQWE